MKTTSESITFLLPGASCGPVGGVKVAVEYANRLAEDGFHVNLVYPASQFFKSSSLLSKLHQIARYLFFLVKKSYSVKRWIYLNPLIKEYWVPSLCERNVPQSDVYIATAVVTAIYLNRYKAVKIKKIYFIQDYEIWTPGMTEEIIWESYRYPMEKIVISHWLENMLLEKGLLCTRIPNGFDFDYFKLTRPIEGRDEFVVSMLYHKLERKGVADGIEALKLVKKEFPELIVNMFGACQRPSGLPDWFAYIQQPNRDQHNTLYNDSAIFLGTSHSEGWGLTIGEAMICGCAVVCTDNYGYREMVKDRETAIVVPIKSPEKMADAIISLIRDDKKRVAIAKNGNNYIKSFTWDKSYVVLKDLCCKETE